MKQIEILQVIVTRLKVAWSWQKWDPYRTVTQYWDMEWNLLVEIDNI